MGSGWTLANHASFAASGYRQYLPFFENTAIVSGSAAALVVLLSVPFAYASTRYDSALVRVAYGIPFFGYFLPPVLLIFPYSGLLQSIGLYDSIPGLILANTAFCLPFGLGLMVQYFRQAPLSLDGAASLDGAGWWQAACRVVLPQVMPGVAAVLAFAFVLSWNDVVLSLVLTEGPHRTIAAAFNEDILLTDHMKNYGEYAAASLWATVPVVLLVGILMYWLSRRDSATQ